MKKFSAIFFGGILPIAAFTIIEEYYGAVYGTIAGMAFGLAEVIFEKIKYNKVSALAWISNGLIALLGGLAVWAQDGIWFKLQPAIFEAFFAFFLWGSVWLKKNFLLMMAEKQGSKIPDILAAKFPGLTIRLGFFFALHSGLATYAAFYWTTTQWAWLKGAGVSISMIVYIVTEMLIIRWRLQRPRP